MALAFNFRQSATIKAKDSTSTDMYTVNGTTMANITPSYAAEQINKIFDIVGLAVVADSNMTRVQTQEAVDDGN